MKKRLWILFLFVFVSCLVSSGCYGEKANVNLAEQEIFASQTAVFFPEGLFGAFTHKWYAEELIALQEPSLWELSEDPELKIIRLLYLPSFREPICIRMDLTSGKIFYKKGRLQQDLEGSILEHRVMQLTEKELAAFEAILMTTDFWSLPTFDDSLLGLDGVQWVVEGVINGRYHVVDRWDLLYGDIKPICKFMIRFAQKND